MHILRQTASSLLGTLLGAVLLTGVAPHHASAHKTASTPSPAYYRYLHDPMYDLTPGLLRPDGLLDNRLMPTNPDAQG